MYPITLLGYFLLWTLVIYVMHRVAHKAPFLWYFHRHHHQVSYRGEWEFSWWNTLGWFNDWYSTIDQWLLEVIPTIALITAFPDAWPIGVYYYIDGFCLAEGITDHNPRICIPGLAMGRYHLRHHANLSVNFDQFTHFWDWVFGTKADPIPKGHFIKARSKANGKEMYTGIVEKDIVE